MKKIKVLIKDPGTKPRCVWISNTLANLQRTVGGCIETFTFLRDAVIICNEEGRRLRLPYNCKIFSVDFVGTIIFAGVRSEEFADFPINYQETMILLPELWEVPYVQSTR